MDVGVDVGFYTQDKVEKVVVSEDTIRLHIVIWLYFTH